MRKIQVLGVHHITLTGADRQTSIDFWEGLLGMPFIFDQPNLDDPNEGHLYFDPGDGRLITVFTNEDRKPDRSRTSMEQGAVHHLAFEVDRAMLRRFPSVWRPVALGIPASKIAGLWILFISKTRLVS
jgi:glyoxalase family protein